MISITKTTLDTAGAIVIKQYKTKSNIQDALARVSKATTLDGGVVVVHSGFADGDRKILIKTRLSETVANTLWDVFKSETFVNLAIIDGVFNAAISKLQIDNGDIRMTVEIESKLSA